MAFLTDDDDVDDHVGADHDGDAHAQGDGELARICYGQPTPCVGAWAPGSSMWTS